MLERIDLPLEALGEHIHFLAEGRRRRRLPVRACEHRRRGMGAGERDDLLLHLFKRRKHHFLNGIAKREAMRDAVHVFRCEREVHPFENILEARSFELELDEILDRLHIVIGGRNSLISLSLDLLDDVRVFYRDISKATEELELLLGERAHHIDIPSARRRRRYSHSTMRRLLIRAYSLKYPASAAAVAR